MKKFSDFGIKNSDPFMGYKKIDIEEIFDKEITVTAYAIEPSKYFEEDSKKAKNANPYCLKIAFLFDGKRIAYVYRIEESTRNDKADTGVGTPFRYNYQKRERPNLLFYIVWKQYRS